MSKPGIIYNGTFVDQQHTSGTDVTLAQRDQTLLIYDYGNLIDDASTEETIYIELSDKPLMTSTVDNSEDKFTVIRSTRADVKIYTSDRINLNTFCDGNDNRFLLVWYCAGQVHFKGWLMPDDMEQVFQPDPNELLLSFTDNLNVLKDKPLLNASDANPTGYNKIISYIYWALLQTELTLPINVVMNVREKHTAPVSTTSAVFTASGSTITAPECDFFLVGKSFTINGSTSNDGTYTVSSRSTAGGTDTVTVTPGVSNESAGATVVFQDTNPHMYDSIYLNAKTFEKEVGESVDCRTALEIILGEHCSIFQQWGEWYIVSIDERDDQFQRVAHFNGGVFTDFTTTANYYKDIGDGENIFLINDDAVVRPERAYNRVELTYKLELPEEIICNSELDRGTLISTISDTHKTYTLDDWTEVIIKQTDGTITPSGFDAYITKKFTEQGDIEDKYITLENETYISGAVGVYAVKSCAIPLSTGDKFTFTGNWRLSSAFSGSGSTEFMIGMFYLEGDDGTNYIFTYESGGFLTGDYKWVAVADADFFSSVGASFIGNNTDESQPQSFTRTVDPVPTGGDLYIFLYDFAQATIGMTQDIWYSDLRFEYIPKIAGTYQRYNRQRQKITNASGLNNAKREKTVKMSDSPRKLFKGAMFKKDGSDYLLTELFYRAHLVVPPEEPATTDFAKFGEWQVWWVWNQYRLSTRHFEVTCQGLDTNSMYGGTLVNPVSLLQKFYLVDEDENTATRQFVMLHWEADWHLGEWTGFLSEVMNFTEGKAYTDTHEFRYLLSNE